MLAAGEDVCSFAAGEPDFDTPEHIKEAAIAALRAGKTKYGPTPGMESLRAAIADSYAMNYGLKVTPAQVIVSAGGKYSCYLAILATCSPGDEVIISAPYWVSYPEMVKLAGATPKFVLTTDTSGFKMSPAQLESAITPKTRLVVLNSPSNPTGAVYTRAELAAIVAVAVKHNLYILSDEMYEHLIYDGAKPTCVATLSPEAEARTLIVAGFSKTYSMTGWRLGMLTAPAPLTKACIELQSQMSSNPTSFAQFGAPRRAYGEGEDGRRADDNAHGLRPPAQIPARRVEQYTWRQLSARRGCILSFSEHLQLRAQGYRFLREIARAGKSRGGTRLGLWG